jgi:hypothetical protein
LTREARRGYVNCFLGWAKAVFRVGVHRLKTKFLLSFDKGGKNMTLPNHKNAAMIVFPLDNTATVEL